MFSWLGLPLFFSVALSAHIQKADCPQVVSASALVERAAPTRWAGRLLSLLANRPRVLFPEILEPALLGDLARLRPAKPFHEEAELPNLGPDVGPFSLVQIYTPGYRSILGSLSGTPVVVTYRGKGFMEKILPFYYLSEMGVGPVLYGYVGTPDSFWTVSSLLPGRPLKHETHKTLKFLREQEELSRGWWHRQVGRLFDTTWNSVDHEITASHSRYVINPMTLADLETILSRMKEWDVVFPFKPHPGYFAELNQFHLTGDGHLFLVDPTDLIWKVSKKPLVERSSLEADHERVITEVRAFCTLQIAGPSGDNSVGAYFTRLLEEDEKAFDALLQFFINFKKDLAASRASVSSFYVERLAAYISQMSQLKNELKRAG